MSKVLNVTLPDELAKRLECLSKKSKKPKSFYIKKMLEEYLEEYEDAAIALERLKDPNAEYYSTEEAEKILGL